MSRSVRFVVAFLLIVGIAIGWGNLAATQSTLTQVSTISGSEFTWIFATVKVEDIAMCQNGTDAWAIGIGPGAFDDAVLFKITGVNTANPSVDQDSFIGFPDPSLDGTFPAGMGPRGYPGLEVDTACQNAYFGNFFGDSVVRVSLTTGELVWPEDFDADPSTGLFTEEQRVLSAPVDVKLNAPADDKLLVSSADGAAVMLDAATGTELANINTGGVGPGSIVTFANDWGAVLQNDQTIACIDFVDNSVSTVTGLGNNPFMGVATGDRAQFYVSNQGSNSVSVLSGSGCDKAVVKEIEVGASPRHIALSPDEAFLYVSNSTDNTVSVIDTAAFSVIETLQVVTDEPAPVGMLTVSNNNRYLYVFWEGGTKGTPGTFQIQGFDTSKLYGGSLD